jgi:uncharacterized protein
MSHLQINTRTKRGLAGLAAVATMAAGAVTAAPAANASAPVDPNKYATSTGPSTWSVNTSEPSAAWNSTTAYRAVKYNRLYRTGRLAASKCPEPRYTPYGAGNILAYARSMEYCMSKVWSFKVRGAKYKFWRPNIVAFTGNYIRTQCGIRYQSQTAAYCSAGRGTILIPALQYSVRYRENPGYTRAYFAFTMAHEYGHHVQHMTGILDGWAYRYRYVMKTSGQRDEETRRLELQASCMGAVYLGADRAYWPIRGAFYQNLAYVMRTSGDENSSGPNDHGSRRSHNFWTTRGYNYQSAYTCMTWAAPSYYVW